MNQEALDKLGWRLGCQAYTFRKLTLFETIDLLSAMGIRYIEMYPGSAIRRTSRTSSRSNMAAELIEQLQKKLKDANVTAGLYGVVELPMTS